MDTSAFALVLFSALLHSVWNFFTKKTEINRIVMLWCGWFCAGIISLPFALYYSDLSGFHLKWVLFIFLTSVVHALYLYLLGWSYSLGEMLFIYPLARGFGILLTMSVVLIFNIEALSKFGYLGVMSLAAGIMLIAFKKVNDLNKMMPIAASFLVGTCTCTYSIIDKFSVQVIPPFLYISLMFFFTPIILSPIIYFRLKDKVRKIFKHHLPFSASIGLVTFVTYSMILKAMTLASATYVVALREVAIIFGAILGVKLLNEELNLRKIIGIIAIFFGAMLIKLA